MALSKTQTIVGGLILVAGLILVGKVISAVVVPLILAVAAVAVIYMFFKRGSQNNPQANHEQSSHLDVLNKLGPTQSQENNLDNNLSEKPGQFRNPIIAPTPQVRPELKVEESLQQSHQM